MFSKKKYHRIVHMSSFSRSGETLMLRALNAHNQIHVVNQLRYHDREEDNNLLKFLMSYKDKMISEDHPIVKAAGVKSGQIILVKNAFWEHQYDYDGFVLVRNPFSVINSFKVIDEAEEKRARRLEQLRRWTKTIDVNMLPSIDRMNSFEFVCALYVRKMLPLADLKLPIIKYEDFVTNPKYYMRLLLKELDIDWDENVLSAHEFFREGDVGHGGIKLWKPIHRDSVDSYQKLDAQTLSKIYTLTWPVIERYGYHNAFGK